MSSGNAEADHILDGGFPPNSINIVMGHPGSGKTIFAEQLIFHNASEDRPILYLTTLSEPLAKVVRYLQEFRFFDERKLGTQVIYEDIGPQLAEGGAAR
jgi:circadian clock protein KaiC